MKMAMRETIKAFRIVATSLRSNGYGEQTRRALNIVDKQPLRQLPVQIPDNPRRQLLVAWGTAWRRCGGSHHWENEKLDRASELALADEIDSLCDLLTGETNEAEPEKLASNADDLPVSTAKFSVRDLAERHSINAEALRKRLERWRMEHDAGYVEVTTRRRNEPKFLYDEAAIMLVITDLKNGG